MIACKIILFLYAYRRIAEEPVGESMFQSEGRNGRANFPCRESHWIFSEHWNSVEGRHAFQPNFRNFHAQFPRQSTQPEIRSNGVASEWITYFTTLIGRAEFDWGVTNTRAEPSLHDEEKGLLNCTD